MLGVLLVLCGYLLGSVPTGLLVGRAFGVDVLKEGSGNIGMANAAGAGKWPAALTMLGDMLKGFVPVVLARAVTDDGWVKLLWPLPPSSAPAGRCSWGSRGARRWPPEPGRPSGSRCPWGWCSSRWWTVALTSRYTSLAAIVLMIVSPFAFLLTGQPLPYVIYTVVGGVVVLWRHRENAKALLAGRERKFGERARKKRAR